MEKKDSIILTTISTIAADRRDPGPEASDSANQVPKSLKAVSSRSFSTWTFAS